MIAPPARIVGIACKAGNMTKVQITQRPTGQWDVYINAAHVHTAVSLHPSEFLKVLQAVHEAGMEEGKEVGYEEARADLRSWINGEDN